MKRPSSSSMLAGGTSTTRREPLSKLQTVSTTVSSRSSVITPGSLSTRRRVLSLALRKTCRRQPPKRCLDMRSTIVTLISQRLKQKLWSNFCRRLLRNDSIMQLQGVSKGLAKSRSSTLLAMEEQPPQSTMSCVQTGRKIRPITTSVFALTPVRTTSGLLFQ